MSYDPKVVRFDATGAYAHHRAMLNLRENNEIDALELMRTAVERAPEDIRYRMDLAQVYTAMGCHEQAGQVLLDVMTRKDAPSECLYDLAVSQLGRNDPEGARRTLKAYEQRDPEGARARGADQLMTSVALYQELRSCSTRTERRAEHLAEMACEAMCDDDANRAARLFEKALSVSPEWAESRALYAAALQRSGDGNAALSEAARAVAGEEVSAKALCMAAQVFWHAGRKEKARHMLRQALDERDGTEDSTLLLFMLDQTGMYPEADEYARLALQFSPFDRRFLHARAAANCAMGRPLREAERCWRRILRIDPDDTVAEFWLRACERGEIPGQYRPNCVYRLPGQEELRRIRWLSDQLTGKLESMPVRWRQDEELRRVVLWAVRSERQELVRVAITLLAAAQDDRARGALRQLLFDCEADPATKLYALKCLEMQGESPESLMPYWKGPEDAFSGEEFADGLPVGESQALRYTADVLSWKYGLESLFDLSILWTSYRSQRGMNGDPICRTEALCAALALCILRKEGRKVRLRELAGLFGCPVRQLRFYARHMLRVLMRLEENHEDP